MDSMSIRGEKSRQKPIHNSSRLLTFGTSERIIKTRWGTPVFKKQTRLLFLYSESGDIAQDATTENVPGALPTAISGFRTNLSERGNKDGIFDRYRDCGCYSP